MVRGHKGLASNSLMNTNGVGNVGGFGRHNDGLNHLKGKTMESFNRNKILDMGIEKERLCDLEELPCENLDGKKRQRMIPRDYVDEVRGMDSDFRGISDEATNTVADRS